MSYKDDYKDYKTGDWYEIERQTEFIGEYDPDKHDDLDMIQRGMYREFFDQAETVLERKPTVFDYHNLYNWILNNLTTNIITDNLWVLMSGEELSITYEDIIVAFENEKKKLDTIFNEFAEKIETQADLSIKEFPKNTTEREKEILNYLSLNYQIKRGLSDNGLLPLQNKTGTKTLLKYLYNFKPSLKDFQAFNFLKAFIETNLPDATLQNYCREVRKDIKFK
jgi:hypothetical protein